MRTPILLIALLTVCPGRAQDQADLAMVHRIKHEALENSKVMEHLFYLTDVYGPRLAGSPEYKTAADWVVRRLTEIGLKNARLEKFGPFGRSWTYTRFSAHLIEPRYASLIGFPLAWSPGTQGALRLEPVLAVMPTEEDFAKFKGKLKGKAVMVEPPRAIPFHTTPDARRYSEKELDELAQAAEPGARESPPPAPAGFPRRSREEAQKFRNRLIEFLNAEGAAVVLTPGYRGDGGTVFASSGGSREKKNPLPPTWVALTPEHYNRLARLLEHKVPARIEIEVEARLVDEEQDSFNVVAELPGSRKKDELVMLGGHLDSWHGGTGATDNAAGCAVAIEAMRILKALNVPLDRTVRVALWGAEEQGLLGSKAYVKQHFADPETMSLQPAHARLSAYFNLDNGTGKVRGVYLQGNDMVRPIFAAWLAPFADLGASKLSIRNTRGTDHLSFDAVGLPGFQFIQDPAEYSTRTHHSNFDVYDYVQKGDLMQASAIMASFVYHAAMRDQLLPRKPLPKPQPAKPEGKAETPSGN